MKNSVSQHTKNERKKIIQHGIPKNEFLILFFSFIFFLPSHSSCCLFLVKKWFFFREYKFIPVSFDVAFFLGSDIIYISLMQQEFSIVCFFGWFFFGAIARFVFIQHFFVFVHNISLFEFFNFFVYFNIEDFITQNKNRIEKCYEMKSKCLNAVAQWKWFVAVRRALNR